MPEALGVGDVLLQILQAHPLNRIHHKLGGDHLLGLDCAAVQQARALERLLEGGKFPAQRSLLILARCQLGVLALNELLLALGGFLRFFDEAGQLHARLVDLLLQQNLELVGRRTFWAYAG